MRDLRIDFFRGLAIYMIFVDHVSGDPLAKFTYHMIGLSDAAELFVFLSGLACGIAYSRMLARDGFAALTWAVIRRAGRIYLYYVLSSIIMIVLAVSATKHLGLSDPFSVPADDPLSAISSALMLSSPPQLSGILVLYIALTLVVVPLLLATPARYRSLVLTASGLVWLACQIFPSSMTPAAHRLFVNPFAWQFLFAIGMTLGIERECRHAAPPAPARLRWLVATAWVVVIGAFLYRIMVSHSVFDIASLRLSRETAEAMKENLSPARLIHFLSVALLVAVYFHRDSAFLRWRVAQPMIKAGRHSLEVFSLSIVLTTMVNIFVLTGSPSLGGRLAADAAAFICLALAATTLAYRRMMTVGKS